MRLALCAITLAALSTPAVTQTQTAAPQELTGAVSGHVICGDTNQPARFARVSLQPASTPSPAKSTKTASRNAAAADHAPAPSGITVGTGLDGAFTLTQVRPGSYYVVVEKEGYINPRAMFTAKEIEDPTPQLRSIIEAALPRIQVEAAHTERADVRLERGAAVSGTVLFDDGTPAGEISVKLLHQDQTGKWVALAGSSRNFGAGVPTDDRGHFRMASLLPDTYLLQADMVLSDSKSTTTDGGNGRKLQFVLDTARFTLPFYGRGTPHQDEAKPFTLVSGDERTGEDMTLPISDLHRLTGHVAAGPDAHLVNAASLELVTREDQKVLATSSISRDDGLFHFEFVPNGDYILRVSNARDVVWEQPKRAPNAPPDPFPQNDIERVLQTYGSAEQPVILRGDQLGFNITVPPSASKDPAKTRPAAPSISTQP